MDAMIVWYKTNQRLYRKEQRALASVQPGMSLDVRTPGFRISPTLVLKQECAIAAGTYSLKAPGTGHYDYQIAVILPDTYPASPCVVYCDDAKLPIGNLDRHILSDGQACVALPGDLWRRWKPAHGLVGFLAEFVSPFLAWQVFYDAHGQPPPWGQRSHGAQGIIEFYAELLNVPVDSRVPAFVSLLARKNPPKGHEPCPCDSGRRLRDCHALCLRETRGALPWQAARCDMAVLEKIMKQKEGESIRHDAGKT